eukprot:14474831-Ditylum_brightwellii.AAC.1
MAQLIPTLLKKDVIELENEDISKSEESTDMSAFKAWPLKKAKVVTATKKKAGKKAKKEKRAEKVASMASSVSDDTKTLIAKEKSCSRVKPSLILKLY